MSELEYLNINETVYETEIPDGALLQWSGPPANDQVRAFIPGIIHEVRVQPGSRVEAGDVLLLLEAMKMYNEVTAPRAGRVQEIRIESGDVVEKNQLLVTLE